MTRTFVALTLAVLVAGCNPQRERAGNATATGAAAKPQAKKKYVFTDITYAYHGLLLDRDRNIIPTDVETLEQLQDSMLTALEAPPEAATLKALAERKIGDFRLRPALDRDFAAKVLSNQQQMPRDERAAIKSALIESALAGASEQERLAYAWRGDLIRERLLNRMGRDNWRVRPEFQVRLTPELLRIIERLGMPSSRTDYIADCQAHDVPIPPDWPTGDWRDRGALPFQFNFLASGPDTEVWTYQAPGDQGICYALPRKTGTDISLLGTICQSKRTGRACFWDNIDAATGRTISGTSVRLHYADLKNGSDLAENCTECHRGGNAFIIHPETPLGLGANRDPDVRYEPIGRAAFTNPPPMSGLFTGACTGCHEIGGVSTSYCGILSQVASRTMPVSTAPAGWDSPRAPYTAHIAFLHTQCPP